MLLRVREGISAEKGAERERERERERGQGRKEMTFRSREQVLHKGGQWRVWGHYQSPTASILPLRHPFSTGPRRCPINRWLCSCDEVSVDNEMIITGKKASFLLKNANETAMSYNRYLSPCRLWGTRRFVWLRSSFERGMNGRRVISYGWVINEEDIDTCEEKLIMFSFQRADKRPFEPFLPQY